LRTPVKIIRITTVPISLKILLRGQLEYLTRYFEVVAISSDGPFLNQVARDEKVRTYSLDLSRKISPVRDIISITQLYRVLLKERPDIVHSHTPKAGLVAMAAACLAGVPVRMHTVAGLPFMECAGMKRWILIQVEKIVYRLATNIYPISFGLRDFILGNRLTGRKKLKVLGHGSSNGINTRHFSLSGTVIRQADTLRIEYGIETGEIVFVYIGRIVKEKGIRELLRAFGPIWGYVGNCRLFLVGPTEDHIAPLSKDISDMIKGNPMIGIPGYQEDVRPWLALGDIFVFPSYREGLGSVLLEAGSMGKPSIVTDIVGPNEVIEHGINGLIVPAKDPLRLQAAMTRLLFDSGLRLKLASEARRKVIEKYEQRTLWESLLTEYQTLLTG